MSPLSVAIVGGGLSGLYAAWLLQRQGLTDWVLLEGREHLGGRILSPPAAHAGEAALAANPTALRNRFDLGPSWFWPGYQPQLDQLVSDLGLERFEQHEAGDMVLERSAQEPPRRVQGFVNAPPSMRLAGGMGALTDALHQRLDATRIQTGQTVRHLRSDALQVALDTEDPAGTVTTWRADHVLLALPPRLVAGTLRFTPALPPGVVQQWQDTPTWMAPHAKYVALYGAPFWREQGWSGEARSACGPMAEIHDASMPGGSAALFGFLGVPVRARQSVSEAVLRAHCRAQLVRLFGPQAATPQVEFFKDWALDPFTATAADAEGSGQHPDAPVPTVSSGPWCGCLTGIGSEWSPQFPGYLAGAIEAASLGVLSLSARRLA